MLSGRLPSLIFLLCCLPLITSGLQCGSGGTCYGYGAEPLAFLIASKTCADACVSFRCFVEDGKIMEGAGCYEDFVNACKYTRTEIKDQIKANPKNSNIREPDVYFSSCDSSDGCATNNSTVGVWTFGQDDAFGGKNLYKQNPDLECSYDTEPKQQLKQLQCKTKIHSCISGADFKWPLNEELVGAPEKTCDACMNFACTTDGKNITSGYGCYDDFVGACSFLEDGVKEKLKNQTDALYIDRTSLVFACSDAKNCHEWGYSKLYYSKSNNYAKTLFKVDQAAAGICPSEATTSSPSLGPMVIDSTTEEVIINSSTTAQATTTPSSTAAATGYSSFGCLMVLLLGLNSIRL